MQNSKVQPTDQQPVSGTGTHSAIQQQWVQPVEGIPGCPPGLEYLANINQLVISQDVELVEVFTPWEQNNKYKIMNSQGQQIFFCAEDTGVCMRQCCGANRGFTIHIMNNSGEEVMRLRRDFKCCAGGANCWCAAADCCTHEVIVEAPVGQILGYVRQEFSCWSPYYTVRDAQHSPVLRLHGPCCVIRMPCCEDTFAIWTEDDTQDIGEIRKQKGLQEFLAAASTFGATFPVDLDVKVKGILLGAVFLIDFMFFESAGGSTL